MPHHHLVTLAFMTVVWWTCIICWYGINASGRISIHDGSMTDRHVATLRSKHALGMRALMQFEYCPKMSNDISLDNGLDNARITSTENLFKRSVEMLLQHLTFLSIWCCINCQLSFMLFDNPVNKSNLAQCEWFFCWQRWCTNQLTYGEHRGCLAVAQCPAICFESRPMAGALNHQMFTTSLKGQQDDFHSKEQTCIYLCWVY